MKPNKQKIVITTADGFNKQEKVREELRGCGTNPKSAYIHNGVAWRKANPTNPNSSNDLRKLEKPLCTTSR
jgi:hypothetical protein